ncbi:unnamed protein product [Hydatigera taeniaeformis]|uniref:inositol-1,3,4-trisphosphate 5/6-kinase n=1 Tax=Hydatigena taeniaeformis TaxID=6205 RepID=A0A3P7EBE4_HYDTA|nr:unnamed protein product [Hydatigera taeniaeformis]
MDAIALVSNRYSQLISVSHAARTFNLGNLLLYYRNVRSFIDDIVVVPSFCLCVGNRDLDIRSLQDANVNFPAVCKPLASHGKTAAHKMVILFKQSDLSLIKCHSVVQSFENHNGILLKAYVIGDFLHLVTRPSIKNLSKEYEPIFFNSRDVSKENSHSVLNNTHDVPSIEDLGIDKSLMKRVIDSLRVRLRLKLMGVDFVIPSSAERKHHLAIIDVNVFPAKIESNHLTISNLLLNFRTVKFAQPHFTLDYSCVPNFHFHLENLVRNMLDLPAVPLSAAAPETSV